MVYDISMTDKKGQKVLRHVFKKSKQYLNHIQNSVFEGNLTEAKYTELKYKIDNIIRKEKDSVIFFTSSNENWLQKNILGLNKNDLSNIL